MRSEFVELCFGLNREPGVGSRKVENGGWTWKMDLEDGDEDGAGAGVGGLIAWCMVVGDHCCLVWLTFAPDSSSSAPRACRLNRILSRLRPELRGSDL
jgi:hypothetical protein